MEQTNGPEFLTVLLLDLCKDCSTNCVRKECKNSAIECEAYCDRHKKKGERCIRRQCPGFRANKESQLCVFHTRAAEENFI
jgi:hypothetical protein